MMYKLIFKINIKNIKHSKQQLECLIKLQRHKNQFYILSAVLPGAFGNPVTIVLEVQSRKKKKTMKMCCEDVQLYAICSWVSYQK